MDNTSQTIPSQQTQPVTPSPAQPAPPPVNDITQAGSSPVIPEATMPQVSQPKIAENTPTDQPLIKDVRPNVMTTTDALNPETVDEKPEPKTEGKDDDEVISEIEELDKKVKASKMPEDLRQKAFRSIERLRRMAKRGSYTGEFETIEKYIYWITQIPWQVNSKDNLDIDNAKRIMDSSHYGMNTVKNLVLDYLAVMNLQEQTGMTEEVRKASADMAILRGNSANAPVMLFVGLQGVGKTSIAKSIAQSMGREFIRVALGAIGGVQALRGQSKAFLDAEPGQIVKAVVRAGTMNPVLLLDEIDKTSGKSGLLNDVMAALLEILDPEQNATFSDHYIDYPIDLSDVFFICTANNLGSLSAALLDRMEIIRFTSYDDEEKTHIAKHYTMPKVLRNTGMTKEQLVIEEAVWPILVRPVGFDAGLRQLERNVATMVRAVARRIVEGAVTPIVITPDNVREFVLPDQGPLS